jgi:PAS domain S-box-containing protein
MDATGCKARPMKPDRLSILLVEMNPSDGAMLQAIIAEASAGTYQAEHATNTQAALTWLRKTSFDAIVLGAAEVPQNDQLALLRLHAPTTPIVALTSGEDDAASPHAPGARAHTYLSRRSLAGHSLLRAIHTAIERGHNAALAPNPGIYHTLVEHLPFGVSQIERSGQLQIANPATAHLLGLPDNTNAVGRSFLDLFPATNRDYIAALIERAFTGERMEIEGSLMVNGRQRVFRSSLIPIMGANASIQTLLAMTQDVTELIEQRLEAEIERDRLSAAIQSSNDAIIMFDLNRQLTLVNRAWGTLFGTIDHELLGLTDQQILEQIKCVFDEPTDVLDMLNQLFDSPQNEASGELIIHSPEYHSLIWYSVPVRTSAGSSLGRLFIFRDATRERKADQIKTQFVSTVTHERRTPLTSIKGFTDLILEGDAGPITPEVREFLAIVQSSADRLVAITNDILETSRIEAGQVTLNAQPLNLSEAIHLIADAIQPLLASKQQNLTIDLPPDLPLVNADRDRLSQIMTNLLSNAHKYTPSQGHICIQAYLAAEHDARHPAPATAQAPWLIICVADNGIGIAPQDQERLFTRFYRVNNPVALRAGGTGLGLSITRSLVELHRGRIWYQSQPGSGSAFFFSLPVQP